MDITPIEQITILIQAIVIISIPVFLISYFWVKYNSRIISTKLGESVVNAGMLTYYLPKSQVKVKAKATIEMTGDKWELIEQTFELLSEITSDTSNVLILEHASNLFMNDTLKYSVDDDGLLSTTASIMEDRTSAMIQMLVTSPKETSEKFTTKGSNGREQFEPMPIEVKAEFIIEVNELLNPGKNVEWIIPIKGNKYVDASFTLQEIVAQNADSSPIVKPNLSVRKSYSGILSRPKRNAVIKITSEIIHVKKETSLVLIDSNRLCFYPIRRSAFAKREQNITFSKGLIKEHELKSPSSLEGFLNIPINIGKAIVSIPGQLLSFKINQIKQESELIKEKNSYLSAQIKLEKLYTNRAVEMEAITHKLAIESRTRENDLLRLENDMESARVKSVVDLTELKKELEALKKSTK